MATVKTGKLEIGYSIEEEIVDERPVYHWFLDNGDESDEWFITAARAEADVKRMFSLS